MKIKKLAATICALTVTMASMNIIAPTSALEDDIQTTTLAGDVNEDGVVSVADLVMMSKAIVGTTTLTPQGIINGDIDKSGEIKVNDLVALCQLILNGSEEPIETTTTSETTAPIETTEPIVTTTETTQPVEAVNQIENGDFNKNIEGWGLYKDGGSDASIYRSSDGRLVVDIKDTGTLNYGIQVYYDGMKLYKNGVYNVKFDISSDVDRGMEFMVQQSGGTYAMYGYKKVALTSTKQTVDFDFTMKEDSDDMAKFAFNLGFNSDFNGEHKIYIDNVSFTAVDESNADIPEPEVKVEQAIVLNQVGYLPDAKKTIVFRGENIPTSFDVVNADTGEIAYTGTVSTEGKTNTTANEVDWYGDFSELKAEGTYIIKTADNESYKFKIGSDIYNDVFKDAVKMFYMQRCGCELPEEYAGMFSHPECHTEMATIYGTDKKIDVSGGWHDAGDYGRYTVAAATTAADLLLAYQTNPSVFLDNTGIPESGNGTADVLDEVKYALDWMFKMQDTETGGVYHKVTCESFPGNIMPEDETNELFVCPISTPATASFSGIMAMAYSTYKDIDADFAQKCLDASKLAWKFLENNEQILFENPKEITTGEYNDTSDKDERYWAAAELYKITGEQKYSDAIAEYTKYAVPAGFGWQTVGYFGSLAYLSTDKSLQDTATVEAIKSGITTDAENISRVSKKDGYGISLTNFYWGSNMNICNNGVLLNVADDINGTDNYSDYAQSHLDYIFGRNALATSFVTGYGTVAPIYPHHRPSTAKGQAVSGMLAGGVNQKLEDPVVKAKCKDAPIAKRYVDHIESYSTNEVDTYWNSPLVYLLAYALNDNTTPAK